MSSQAKNGSGGPELRGSNITLDKIMAKTETDKRQTKIVCTLGPACWDVPMLEKLIDEGLGVARFNFSHGDHEGHKACLDRLREAASNKKKHVGKFHQSPSIGQEIFFRTCEFCRISRIFQSFFLLQLFFWIPRVLKSDLVSSPMAPRRSVLLRDKVLPLPVIIPSRETTRNWLALTLLWPVLSILDNLSWSLMVPLS